MDVQVWFAIGTCIFAANVAFGIFLERVRLNGVRVESSRKRTKAILNMPERICGAWVFNDGKGRSHHCVLDHDHAGDLHRSNTGMGRKVSA